jgi:PAS domain S-box-containing protein
MDTPTAIMDATTTASPHPAACADLAHNASERQYRALFESIPDAVVIFDRETGRFLTCNQAAQERYGYTLAEWQTLTPYDLHPAEELPQVAQNIADPAAHGPHLYTHLTRTGARLQVEVHSTELEYAGRPASLSIIRDVSERQQVADALQTSEARYRSLIESSENVIALLDSDGRYQYMNAIAAHALGGAPAAFIGQTMHELFPRAEADRQLALVRQVIQCGSGMVLELPTVLQGAPRWYHVSIQPVRAVTGPPTSALINALDITERIRAEQNARQERALAEALRDSLAALTTALDVDTVMQRLLESAACVVDYAAASVMLIEGAEAHVAYRHGAPAAEGQIQGTRVPLTWPKLQQIRDTGTPYLVADTQQSDDWATVPGTEWIRSSIGVPIAIRGEVIGILAVDHATPNHFTPHDVEQLGVFARYAALAVENAYHVAQLERKVAARTAELQHAEARWQFALESAAQGVWDWDPRANRVFYSHQWKAMLGYADDEVGDSLDEWSTRVHPADLTQALADVAQHLDGRTPVYENEHRVLCKDGSYKWILDRGKVIERAADGQPRRVIGTHTDISAYKRIEAALEREAALLQILMEVALRFINIPLDQLDRGITDALARVARFNGADRAYIFEYDFGRAVMNNTHEWCAAGIQPEIANLQAVPMALFPTWVSDHQRGKPVYIPDVLALPPGDALREILEPQDIKTLITIPLTHGAECLGCIGFDAVHEYRVWTTADIALLELLAELLVNAQTRHRNETRMKDAEARLRASEARLREARRIARLGDWELELQTQRWDWSAEIYRVFGIAPAAGPLPLDALRQAIHPDDLTRLEEITRQTPAASGPYELEARVRRPNGEWRHVLVQSEPVRDATGNVQRWIGTLLDITERKQAELALRQALAREKELGELKSRFVSVASHEFRTPLATILAAAETLLAYRTRLTPEQSERRLHRIVEQVEHLRTIIDDVLQYSRIEAGRYQFKPEPMDLAALTREIVDEFSSHPEATHSLQCTCDQEPLMLAADHNLLRQVITNLISNAIKYSPAAATVYIHLNRTADEISLCVRDEGIGIAEADQKHLFEPFYRATNVSGIAGTGLGLAITREAVELHGGRITVQSALGVGTTVCFSIPQ